MSNDTTRLHILLITYNRADRLRDTLQALADSALRACPLTILDNCSRDATPQVCEAFRPRFPHVEVIRHSRNIGFGANYLRALELSRGTYTWVVCDDDDLLLAHAADFLALLESGPCDCYFVGGPRQESWPRGVALIPSAIQERYGTFLTSTGFVPTLVIRTALLDFKLFFDGYFSIATNFPQVSIGKRLLELDIPFMVPEHLLVRRGMQREKGRYYLDVVAGWSEVCREIHPKRRRIQAFYSMFHKPTPLGMFQEIIRMIIWGKLDTCGNLAHDLDRILINVDGIVKAPLWLLRGASMMPAWVFRVARGAYRKVKYGWLRRPLPTTFGAAISTDEFRR